MTWDVVALDKFNHEESFGVVNSKVDLL